MTRTRYPEGDDTDCYKIGAKGIARELVHPMKDEEQGAELSGKPHDEHQHEHYPLDPERNKFLNRLAFLQGNPDRLFRVRLRA